MDAPPHGPAAEPRIEELKRYVRLTEEDARRIKAAKVHVAPHVVEIAERFYDRTREHEDAHAVFRDEEQIGRLQGSLARWIIRLFDGVYDEAYFAVTERVGLVHVKIGLPQRYMHTAMAFLRSSLTSILDEAMGAADAAPTRDALSRLLDIELAVMLDSYKDHYVGRIERAAQLEHEALSRRAARIEHRYVNAVEVAHMLIVGLGPSGDVLLWNREAERVTGWARDEVIGTSFVSRFVPEELRAAQARHFEPRGTDDSRDLALVTRSGKRRDIRWQIMRPVEEGNEDVVVFLLGVDVTEERALRESRQQQERLAAVGTLAAGLAHEIRNPLNGAQLHVSFLERALRALPPSGSVEALEALHVVRDEIRRLARLVTDFLSFARPRPLQLAETSVQALGARVVQLVRPSAEASRVVLSTDLPAEDVLFEADAERLEQVLLNLLQNAVEALSTHGGHVTLRARREPRFVWIEVEDDGPGLSSDQAQIFDAFFSTKVNGTGLGLAIVHRIVTDHGGTIEVQSQPGRTRFRLRLPLSR